MYPCTADQIASTGIHGSRSSALCASPGMTASGLPRRWCPAAPRRELAVLYHQPAYERIGDTARLGVELDRSEHDARHVLDLPEPFLDRFAVGAELPHHAGKQNKRIVGAAVVGVELAAVLGRESLYEVLHDRPRVLGEERNRRQDAVDGVTAQLQEFWRIDRAAGDDRLCNAGLTNLPRELRAVGVIRDERNRVRVRAAQADDRRAKILLV